MAARSYGKLIVPGEGFPAFLAGAKNKKRRFVAAPFISFGVKDERIETWLFLVGCLSNDSSQSWKV
jgi:hypothetical protein